MKRAALLFAVTLATARGIALATVRRRFAAVTGAPALTGLAGRVAAGDLDAYAAADTLLATLG